MICLTDRSLNPVPSVQPLFLVQTLVIFLVFFKTEKFQGFDIVSEFHRWEAVVPFSCYARKQA